MKFHDVNHAYADTIRSLVTAADHDTPPTVRGEAMSAEALGVTIYVHDAKRPIITLSERKLNYTLMLAEALWNLVPIEYDFMRKFNKRADVFVADQGGDDTWARWHYGHVLQQELPRVVGELQADKFTRRAVYTLPQNNRRVAIGTPPCLIGQQFLYREGALHCITTMRSNDAWLGTPLDFFQFMFFQHLVAAGAGLPVGSFTLQAGSLHLYLRDRQTAEAVARINRVPPPAYLSVDNTFYVQFKEGVLYMALDDIMDDREPNVATKARGIAPFLDILMGRGALW